MRIFRLRAETRSDYERESAKQLWKRSLLPRQSRRVKEIRVSQCWVGLVGACSKPKDQDTGRMYVEYKLTNLSFFIFRRPQLALLFVTPLQ